LRSTTGTAFDITADLDTPASANLKLALLDPPAVFLGVTCRNLSTLEIDRSRFDRIETFAHREHVAAVGYRGVLTGDALKRSADQHHAVALMVAAGRATCPFG